MTNGLVIGKFLPYHIGHEALIKYAAIKCDYLRVVVCEDIDITMSSALNNFTSIAPNIRVMRMPYNGTLPYTYEDSSDVASKAWAEAVSAFLPCSVDVVFSSELYGEAFAKHLGAEHDMYDLDRTSIPISGSAIRVGVLENWDFLTTLSKKHLQKHFVLCGTESTGKTYTLEALKKIIPNALYTSEYGRVYTKDRDTKTLTRDDLLAIEEHTEYSIYKALDKLPPVVISDTDWVTTQGYANLLGLGKLKYGQYHRHFHYNTHYLYLEREGRELVQDGTRLPLAERAHLDKIHQANHRLTGRVTFIPHTQGPLDIAELITKELN